VTPPASKPQSGHRPGERDSVVLLRQDPDTDAVSRGGSNGAAGWTGDLVGASMRTVSMRVVIVPRRSEGCPRPLRKRSHCMVRPFPDSHFGGGRNARTPSGRPAHSGSSGSRPTSSRRSGYRLGSPFGFASTKVIVNGGRVPATRRVLDPTRCSPRQPVPPCRSWHRSSSERGRFLIPGSPRRGALPCWSADRSARGFHPRSAIRRHHEPTGAERATT
jgi:hypothetical protein